MTDTTAAHQAEPGLSDHANRAEVDALVKWLEKALSDAIAGVAPRARQLRVRHELETTPGARRDDRRHRETAALALAFAAAALPIVGYGVLQRSSATAFFSQPPAIPVEEPRYPDTSGRSSPSTTVRRDVAPGSPPALEAGARTPARQGNTAIDPVPTRRLRSHHRATVASGQNAASDEARTRRLNLRELHRIVKHRRSAAREAGRNRGTANAPVERTPYVRPAAEKPVGAEHDNSAQAYADDAAITRRLNLLERQRERRRDRNQ